MQIGLGLISQLCFGVMSQDSLFQNDGLGFSLHWTATSPRMAIWTISGTLSFPQHIFLDMGITLFSKTIVHHATMLTLSSSGNLTKTCLVWNGHYRVLDSIQLKTCGENLERQLGVQDAITPMNCNRHWSMNRVRFLSEGFNDQLNTGSYTGQKNTQKILTFYATDIPIFIIDKYFKIN